MSRFLALDYALTVIRPGGTSRRRRQSSRGDPRLLLMMPDPVNAWTRPLTVVRDRPLFGCEMSLAHS